jgi:hypothetical protein
MKDLFMTLSGLNMTSRNYMAFGYRLAFIGLLLYCGNNYASIGGVIRFHSDAIGKCLIGKSCLYSEYEKKREQAEQNHRRLQEEARQRQPNLQ